MDKTYQRIIDVSQEFHEQLESYLQADERFTANEDPESPYVLITPSGKKLLFRNKQQ